MRDTTTEAEQVWLAAIRGMDRAARLRQVLELSESMRALAITGLRRRHPQLTDRQLVALLSDSQARLAGPSAP